MHAQSPIALRDFLYKRTRERVHETTFNRPWRRLQELMREPYWALFWPFQQLRNIIYTVIFGSRPLDFASVDGVVGFELTPTIELLDFDLKPAHALRQIIGLSQTARSHIDQIWFSQAQFEALCLSIEEDLKDLLRGQLNQTSVAVDREKIENAISGGRIRCFLAEVFRRRLANHCWRRWQTWYILDQS